MKYFAFASLLAFSLAACATRAPDGESTAARYAGYMVSAGRPEATEAGLKVLAGGGSAVDAAVAVQAVLGLVQPQSSGLGGGAFIVYYDAAADAVTTYDGRETAPAATKPGQFLAKDGAALPREDQVVGGISVGVPGAMPMLALAHEAHGALPWNALFDEGIRLADEGFVVGDTLNAFIARSKFLQEMPGTRDYFFTPDGAPLAADAHIKNPAYAETLRALQANPRALNEGKIAEDIIKTVAASPRRPQKITKADLANYQPKERPAICGPYRSYTICGMGPPSSGGMTVLQILTMLEPFDLARLGPKNPESWHLIAEAERLAYADRAQWMADADAVNVPVAGLTDRTYLLERSKLIDPTRAAGKRTAGTPPDIKQNAYAPAREFDIPGTSHFTIVDAQGNFLSMTTTIEGLFGSHLMTNGFLLNNQLTDFAALPEEDGRPVANAPAPGKRPLSSMSPTIVFDREGHVVMAVGSPGGTTIIASVVKALIGVLDWDLTMQAAIDLPNLINANASTVIEKTETADKLAAALEAKGHQVSVRDYRSVLHGIRVVPGGYEGGADRRGDGSVGGAAPLAEPRFRLPFLMAD